MSAVAQPLGNVEQIVRSAAEACGCKVSSIDEIRKDWCLRILSHCQSRFGKSVTWDRIVGAQDPGSTDFNDCVEASVTQPSRCRKCQSGVLRSSRECSSAGYLWQMVAVREWKGRTYDHDVYVAQLMPCRCQKWLKRAEEERQASFPEVRHRKREGF